MNASNPFAGRTTAFYAQRDFVQSRRLPTVYVLHLGRGDVRDFDLTPFYQAACDVSQCNGPGSKSGQVHCRDSPGMFWNFPVTRAMVSHLS